MNLNPLTASDCALVLTKHHANRLSFAGRFPLRSAEIDRAMISDIIVQLNLAGQEDHKLMLSGRSLERHRAEIRELLGFREATVSDGEALAEWLQGQTAAVGANADQLTELLEERCRALFIEPPAPDRINRIVRAAIRAHDESLQAEIAGCLAFETRQRLEALLLPARAEGVDEDETGAASAPALLLRLRGNPGKPSVAAIQDELAKLKLLREIDLPANLFNKVLPHQLD
jgi:hypothetical protein